MRISLQKTIVKWLIIVIVILWWLPYAIPIPEDQFAPFDLAGENSMFIEVEGILLHFQDFSPTVTPAGTVIFVHGFGGSGFSFLNNVKPLTDAGYRVILMDLPGFGLSQRTLAAKYSNSDRADLLQSFALELHLTPPVHWVGHSMGGTIIAWLGQRGQGRATSLTLVDAPMQSPGASPFSSLLFLPPVKRALAGLFPRYITEARVEALLGSAFGRALTEDEINGYFRPLKIRDTYMTLMGLFRDRDSTPLQTDNIRVPVLIIWGENDSWVSPEQAALWTDALPQSQLFWVPEGGHNPMETQTALFNHRLLEFLIAVDE